MFCTTSRGCATARNPLSPNERISACKSGSSTADAASLNENHLRSRSSISFQSSSSFVTASGKTSTLYMIDAPLARRLRYRSEEHTSELQSLMRISYAVFCLKKKKNRQHEKKLTTHNYL